MKKLIIGLVIGISICISGCGNEAPKPSLSGEGVEEIRIEEIQVETIRVEEIRVETWDNSPNISRWE